MHRPAAALMSPTVFAALVMTLLRSTACGGNDGSNGIAPNPLDALHAKLPAEPPAISGTITLVQPGDSIRRSSGGGDSNSPVSCPPSCGGSGSPMRRVLIEEVPGGQGDEKSQVSVPRTTVLFRKTAAGVERVGFSDLRVGQRVDAWFTGPVAESYPTQATARAIVVLP